MSYCPHCGTRIVDESKGCSKCGYKPVIDGEIIKEEVEMEKQIDTQSNHPSKYNDNREYGNNFSNIEKGMNLIVKIIIVALIFLLPGIGSIVGIVAGVILLGGHNKEDKLFGKIILIVSISMLGFTFLCCCLNLGSSLLYI